MVPLKTCCRIRPDYQRMRHTKQPRLAEAEGSEAAEAKGSKAAEAQGRNAAEAQGRKTAEAQGPEAADPDDLTDSDGSASGTFGSCLICWKDDHSVPTCPYGRFVPQGALVSPCAEIVCWCCEENPEIAHPGEVVARRAVVKRYQS